MTTAIRLYRTYILSTFVPLNTIRRAYGYFLSYICKFRGCFVSFGIFDLACLSHN